MTKQTKARLPSQHYQDGADHRKWIPDPAQQAALAEFDRLHIALTRSPRRMGWLGRLFAPPQPPPPGLYLWGGVGRGKTFLIDLFYQHLPLPVRHPSRLPLGSRDSDQGAPSRGKYRIHFHRFMQGVHAQLRKHAGARDPLTKIVSGWRDHLRLLLLDEFFVNDIGDAMLLARLLERMFAEGIVLVTTSNTAPSDLYKNGLQRERFLPAIALLEQHCHVLELTGKTDYRLRTLTRSPVWLAPLGADSIDWLSGRWQDLGGAEVANDDPPWHIAIDNRKLPVRARANGMLWCDFAVLCEGPRAASDYICIATEFHTVLLTGVPLFDGQNDDAAQRFITLIDELYDRHVNLICTAAAAPPALYAGQRLASAFARTASRLIEMQSAEYLARAHRA